MTERSRSDTPAIVIAIILGVLLIALSAPFTVALFGDGANAYTVTWGETDAAANAGDLAELNAPVRVDLSVVDLYTAGIRVEVAQGDCADTYNPQFMQNPATITWKVTRIEGGASTDLGAGASGSFTCDEVGGGKSWEIHRFTQPDIAERDGADKDAARSSVWSAYGDLNETATYRLEFSAQRDPPPAGLPIPLPGTSTSLMVTMSVTAEAWQPLISDKVDEPVVR